ncbi:two-component regulator propeller domain-containing protein [Massilia sp. YIM B02769]|uniref:sensor histidine kinase n=1 Tax=Massilia sp. YIM B02769 TaxID=3050129 RepID=UPI0025B670C0|nr:two-component regulator propeller domain-containing protein [Massilia sp. YIM B02769]MDN4059894.1 two-component regulator propeller domain-containing protein [Massilia sp. YIM B02769]
MLGFTTWRRASCAIAGLLLALTFTDAAHATAPRNLRFERLSIEHGLTQESVLTILQDRQGYMWFGTQAGLNRYDGYRITTYRNDPRDPASLPDGYVNASLEDAEGRLWFGTKGGLARLDTASGKFVRYTLLEPGAGGSANRSVNAIAADRHGMLWLATSDGLKRFDPRSGRFTTIRQPDTRLGTTADHIVTSLAFDAQGALWVGTLEGVARLAPGAGQLSYFAPLGGDPRRARVLALAMGPRATLWVGAEAGLEEWRLGEGEPQRRAIGIDEGMGHAGVLSLYVDAGGTLWAGTDFDGLKWREPTSGRFVSYRNRALDQHSLSDNQVAAVRIDRTGTLWVGTRFGGVSRTDLASGGFSHFSFEPGNGYQNGYRKARDVAVRANGQVWIGTSGGGLVLFDPASGRTRALHHQPGKRASLPSDVVHSLSIADGRLWVGTPAGLAWCPEEGGDFHPVDLGPDGNAALVQAVMKTRDGATWVVSRAGLYLLGPDQKVRKSWRHNPDDAASLGENRIFAMVEDKDGILWVATDNGLDRFDRGANVFTHFRQDDADPDSLRHNRIHDVLLSARGELWIGTGGGLHRMERGPGGKPVFRYFTITDTGQGEPVGALLEDGSGRLWASTTVGLSRIDPASGEYKQYTAKDGLIDGSFFVGSAARGPDGQLHFGGVNGLNSFQPDAIRDNPYPPVVRITDFTVFNKARPLPAGGAVTLPARDSVFALEFAALHYAAPGSNRYAYQLEGFDESWVETDASKRFASYTNLDPGEYVFRVRASNKDGVWSEAPATLAIRITPPWWKTWWFRLLAVALLGAAALAAYRFRIRSLVQQKGRLERQVNARTAELLLQKDAAERRKREAEQQKDAADQARRNIALLSDIGRRLTANLDIEAIMDTLHEHVQVLMDAPVFAVVVAGGDEGTLDIPYALVDGRRAAPSVRARRDPASLAAWSIDHGREVFINDLASESGRYLPGATPEAVAAAALPGAASAQLPRSLLYVPVAVGQRVLGALAVQSYTRGAYQRVHLDMLRTLAAYVGVALDNAQAYRQLKDAQSLLASQEKLASLGSLVAGVAHELNTPIGNSLLMASTLHDKTADIHAALGGAALRRSELDSYIGAAREASELIMRSLHQAAELVNSFRQVSVDQASAQRRRFDLARACQEILATMMNKVRLEGHTLAFAVPDGIVMDSYPGPFGQVMINFVNNALLHAFAGPGGQMRLSARLVDPAWVQLRFADDGRGIAPEHLARVFDPFFTTRMGQGGTGLGLNIAHTIVTSLLGGAIRVESTPGQGTVFILDLPLAPAEARPPHYSNDERKLHA